MLTPTIATKVNYFYAAGNTPATSLTRCVPQGQDATVLSLGCGDFRNVLYTAYIEKGLPKRKLDFTCLDYDAKIIGRNILLLSLLIDDDEEVSHDSLWDIYYHIFVNDVSADILMKQTMKLLSISKSLDDWKNSIYGRNIILCDESSLTDVRQIWQRIRDAAEERGLDSYFKTFESSISSSRDMKETMAGKNGYVIGAMRSAAPVSVKSEQEIPRAYHQYWKEGTVTHDTTAAVPNPMFVALLSQRELLHYGTDPISGYHLATAYAPLAGNSPLKPQGATKGFTAAAAARTQFNDWASAFKTVFGKKSVVRFAVADALMFCHSLQNVGATGKPANVYRRQWDSRPLRLDDAVYSKNGSGPTEFDMIDTSNLGDHIGALNLLVAAGPLLKNHPWASLFTEQLVKREDSQTKILGNLLCGDVPTVSLLLGFSPVQFWTNAKCESHVDEVILGLMAKSTASGETQLHSRLAWKRDDQFSGYPEGRSKLHVEAQALARVIFQLYLQMFEREDASKALENMTNRSSIYPYFHRGSLAALLKMIMNRVQTDWKEMCIALLDMISQDKSLMLATNQMQELCAQLHLQGIDTGQWVLNEIKSIPELGGFHAWKSIPPVVAVTLVVPRKALARLYEGSFNNRVSSPSLVGSLRAGPSSTNQWHNMFGDVHIVFGDVKKTGSRADDDFMVSIEEDGDGWSGVSPLLASFYVPTASLQVEPKSSLLGISVPPTGQNTPLYGPILGINMTVFEARLDNEPKVYVTKFMPGQTGYPAICGGVKPLEDMVEKGKEDRTTKLLIEVPAAESTITTVTGHLDIASKKGKDLLKDKAPIEVRQVSPFDMEIVFGKTQLVCPLKFPIPVKSAGIKTRVARTSSYIEVIALVADAGFSEALSTFIFPATLTKSGVPVALNTPHLNLDNLPILNLEKKDEMRWLVTLASFMFSEREKKLRGETDDKTGISPDPRVNFKESLFTMFMVASGLQAGQTGLFAINHPEKGGIHMLIFISALRIDGDTASVVLDAAVIPFTLSLLESGKMEDFLLLLRTLECCTLNVDDTELVLWKKILPSLAERCRTWSHRSDCEYKRQKTIPLSLEDGAQVLCSCGNGRLPENFIGLPQWDKAAPNAVRVAISPTYSVPFVEEVVDLTGLKNQSQVPARERCRNCSKAEDRVSLMNCGRCRKVKYCSAECQKKDWKKHRGECE
ncbi:Fc.00g014170.m01.CDS01 [Cosmosporella sp. VM-42]